MAHRSGELLALQGKCKRDPESYKADFDLQLQRFEALLAVFSLKPDQSSPELADLITFLAHVSTAYRVELQELPNQLIALLEKHASALQPALRLQIMQALILLRHKSTVTAEQMLPLCFQLFECQDKHLKQLVHGFIIADVRSMNTSGCNDRLNRSIQNYMYKLIEGDSERVTKRTLAILSELWRRHIWRDARTVNVIASATKHTSTPIMIAALKFFLGQDKGVEDAEEGGAEEDNDEPEVIVGPTKDEIYKAYHKGTANTKKRKIRKLKRVMGTLERKKRGGGAAPHEGFAALQLLHDPHTVAEALFARCQAQPLRFETRLTVLQVVSRIIGVHELMLENFYPFVQRYVQASQREVVAVLAVLVQACHRLVPPECLRPVLRQIVDQFVHDRARPEVVTVGLKTVREVCMRCPLVMDEALLSDLVLYRTERDKHVKNAAKALLGLFRELKPSMLHKKERGRGADVTLQLQEYGAVDVQDRVDGADLLQAALLRGDNSDTECDTDSGSDSGCGHECAGHERGTVLAPHTAPLQEREGDDNSSRSTDAGAADASGSDADEARSSEQPDGEVAVTGSDCEGGDGTSDESELSAPAAEGPFRRDSTSQEPEAVVKKTCGHKRERDSAGAAASAEGQSGGAAKAGADTDNAVSQPSLKQLKQQLAATAEAASASVASASGADTAEEAPLEHTRLLTQEDFQRIKRLKVKKAVEGAMEKHGLLSAGARKRMQHKLYEEMEESVEQQSAAQAAAEQRVDPATLLSKRRGRADKAERMASVMAGREGREAFGSSIARKKHKSGGLSNMQQQKRKVVLAGAQKQQAANRQTRKRQKNNPKHQRGRASRGAWGS